MELHPTHSRHIDAARRRVAHAGALLHASDQAEERILQAALDRLATVQGEVAKLRPRASSDDDAAERLAQALLEQGRLQQVIQRANATLGRAP